MGEVTLDLQSVIKIAGSKMTLNGLAIRVKQVSSEIHAAFMAGSFLTVGREKDRLLWKA